MSGARLVSRIGLVIACLSLALMVMGHFGVHELSYISAQISTYAAKAPFDYLITASMLLSCLTLLMIGFINSKFQVFGSSYLAHFVPPLSGAAASGLMLLAYFEETAQNLNALKQSGFMAIRIQSFHDAGLLVFFYGSLMLISCLGLLTAIHSDNKISKMLGGFVFCMGPASFMLMTSRWPQALGFEGITTGLNQRAALLCLWLAFTFMLVIMSNRPARWASKESRQHDQ